MSKPKATQPPVDGSFTYFNDGREVELLRYVYALGSQVENNPQAILDAIDKFGNEEKYLMNVGQWKGVTVEEQIKENKPKVMVELGCYVGYSAISFARHLKNIPGSRYYSIEMDPLFSAIATKVTNSTDV
ncbi:hypothetical protein K7432_013989 [Basidiobolus ranarum]|uniref:catechol O-methyltransferase n=1 Tax=Basidiobolus ranarum TaxID=34480 RepID=A0ABR2VQK0_9FUNG